MGEQALMTTEYVRAKNNAKARRYYARNREQCVSRSVTWRAENPGKVSEQLAAYRDANRATINRKRMERYWKDPEAGRAAARDYADRNPDKVKASRDNNASEHGERNKVTRRRWKDDNRETINRQRRETGKLNREKEKIHGHNYRARKRALPNTLTATEWREILTGQNHACYYCECAGEKLIVEHMTPLSRGGPTTRENVCASCLSCNSSKRDRTVAEFIEYRTSIGKPLACADRRAEPSLLLGR